MLLVALLGGCDRKEPATRLTAPVVSGASASASASQTPPDARPSGSLGFDEDGGVGRLSGPRKATHAYGRRGDLLLFGLGPRRAVLTFGATADAKGHRPLRGALLDVDFAEKADTIDRPDPLLWWRTAWIDKTKAGHLLFADTCQPADCKGGRRGVKLAGKVDGVSLSSRWCPRDDGGFDLETEAKDLPEGASIADEIHPGTADPTVEGAGPKWEGEHTSTSVVAFHEHGIEVRLETASMKIHRRLVHISGESFPAPLLAAHAGNPVSRVVRVLPRAPREEPAPAPVLDLSFSESAPGPPPTKAPLPVHVLLRGKGATKDPELQGGDGFWAGGRSVYLARGAARVHVPPGTYEVVATHGPAYTLFKTTIDVPAEGSVKVVGELARVVEVPGWITADFHLHAAPSPDSAVSLDARVGTLLAEGVDFAVATDHNRITDYLLAPGLGDAATGRLVTMPGVEITSAGTGLLGHFNAFPMKVPEGVPEDGVPPYYEVTAQEMFTGARALGAKIIQVNHARMAPSIGYFDLAKLEPATGKAGPAFSEGFDALEAHNGLWIANYKKAREGAVDLVALARRGMKVAATGNSDSHRLLYEEAGWPRTWVRAMRDEASVIAALRTRETVVSAGPMIEMTTDGERIGAVVRPHVPGKVTIKLKVSAPAWIATDKVEIWRNDAVARTIPIRGPARDGVRLEQEITLELPRKDQTLLVWVESATPIPDVLAVPNGLPIAFTGLTYIDADGDGKITLGP